MNKQDKGDSRGIEWTQFTFNPFKGCKYGCAWLIDDKLAECYAKSIADGNQAQYPDGFDHTQFLPDKLDEPKHHKQPARIFVGSMADVFGHWNTRNQIDLLLQVVKSCYWHDFQFLTKNAPRYKAWDSFPINAWMGASVPPSRMNGKFLTEAQQRQMLFTTIQCLKDTNATTKWMSIEPLSWDCAPIFDSAQPKLDWIVIGAATNGRAIYQPKPEWITDLIDVMRDQGTRVFFKGNLRGNPGCRSLARRDAGQLRSTAEASGCCPYPGEFVLMIEKMRRTIRKHGYSRRRGLPTMTDLMLGVLIRLRESAEINIDFEELEDADSRTIEALLERKWVFARPRGLAKYQITDEGLQAVKVYEPDPIKRVDGLCPRCGERPRRMRSTGTPAPYCGQCEADMQRRNRALGLQYRRSDAICPRCKTSTPFTPTGNESLA